MSLKGCHMGEGEVDSMDGLDSLLDGEICRLDVRKVLGEPVSFPWGEEKHLLVKESHLGDEGTLPFNHADISGIDDTRFEVVQKHMDGSKRKKERKEKVKPRANGRKRVGVGKADLR